MAVSRRRLDIIACFPDHCTTPCADSEHWRLGQDGGVGRDVKAVIRKTLPAEQMGWGCVAHPAQPGERAKNTASWILEKGKQCEAEDGVRTIRQAHLRRVDSDLKRTVCWPCITDPQLEEHQSWSLGLWSWTVYPKALLISLLFISNVTGKNKVVHEWLIKALVNK